MRPALAPAAWLSLVTALLCVCPQAANAQVFLADYDILNQATVSRDSASASVRLGIISMTPAPALAGVVSTGAGLSLRAGDNWFAQVGLGGSVHAVPNPSRSLTGSEVMVGGGYRWGDGQALSLQLSRGQGAEPRLGLAVRYDWPRYFVRLSYDTGLSPIPADKLRFSAGIRF